MSLMTENKARRLLKDYMDAELKGDDSLAEGIETELNNAGWKISIGAEGYTVIRENGGLFSSDSTDNNTTPLPNQQYVPPYTGTTKGSSNNMPMIIGISIGGLILIIAVIFGIRAYKQSKNVARG